MTNRSPRSALSDDSLFCSRAWSNIGSAAEYGCSNAHDGRAFLDGDLEIVAHAHGQMLDVRLIHAPCHQPRPNPNQVTEIRPRRLWIVDGRGNDHQAREPDRLTSSRLFEYRQQRFLTGAVLRGFARQIDLDESFELASGRVGRLLEALQQVHAVDRLDGVEARRCLPRLVRLQVADEMPADRQVRGLVHLAQRFLHFVLPEVDLTGRGCGADGVSGEGFGDGDEADAGGIAVHPAGRPRDARANVGQVRLDGRGV